VTKTTTIDALRQVASSSLFCKKNQLQRKTRKEAETYDDNSHFNGISWCVPSGKVLRIVIGRTHISSSFSAMSIGLDRLEEGSTRMGAPMAI